MVHLYVDKNKRRLGIGEALMDYTLKYLKKLGVEFVDLECYLYNQKAAALYNKIGFKDVFVTKRYYFKFELSDKDVPEFKLFSYSALKNNDDYKRLVSQKAKKQNYLDSISTY